MDTTLIITAEHHLIINLLIQLTSLISISFIINKIAKTSQYDPSMKYYKVYFILALMGFSFKGILDIFHIEQNLNLLVLLYMSVSTILLFALNERSRSKNVIYPIYILIFAIVISSLYWEFTNLTLLTIHVIYAILIFTILFYIAVKRAKEEDNIGFFIMSFGFLTVVIVSMFQVNYILNNETNLAYSTANIGGYTGFLLVIIGFLTMKLMNEHNKLSKLALTDTLTGMNNRRGLYHLLESVIPSSNRSKKCFSLITIDIDFFKNINDTYGHDGGDVVLKEFSSLIKTTHRNSDISSRLGGEEFVIVLPDTDKDSSLLIAEKLRQKTQELEIVIENTISTNITASFGIATSCSDINIDELLKDADKALYTAKFNGRNRAVHVDNI